ncbi:MAG: prepilin peptidase [Neoaquamicrobium sediminum]|uniref:prepilin peptidase n=1 Tax=Neoaquamicrobium sediminum TaxID=1849104 RepID=UPI0040367A20
MTLPRVTWQAIAIMACLLAAATLPPMLQESPFRQVAWLMLCALAAAIAIEDLARMLIPDGYTASIAFVGAALALATHGWAGLGVASIEAAILAACLMLMSLLYERLRGRSGLGFGDVKLLSASALLIGVWGVGMQILFASVAALVFTALRAARRRRPLKAVTRIPFATFLAPALVLVWAWAFR